MGQITVGKITEGKIIERSFSLNKAIVAGKGTFPIFSNFRSLQKSLLDHFRFNSLPDHFRFIFGSFSVQKLPILNNHLQIFSFSMT